MSELTSLEEAAAPFVDEGFITDILFPVKSGKEATVYCCRAHPSQGVPNLALKHYKPRAERSFRNDAVYGEGRFYGGSREARAIRNKSAKGRAFQHASWVGHEFAVLTSLHQAGADVPRPVRAADSAVLLEFIGGDDGPSPTLSSIRLTAERAEALLERAMGNIALMLARHLVHGDLSAYNMLVDGDRLVLIDFPQAIDARENTNARALLARDVANVVRYFARQGVEADAEAIADDLWRRYERASL